MAITTGVASSSTSAASRVSQPFRTSSFGGSAVAPSARASSSKGTSCASGLSTLALSNSTTASPA
jgi:hypothetical protein